MLITMRLTSQLINGILRFLPKLLKYFNGTIISNFFFISRSRSFSYYFFLDLNDSESAKLSFGSFL